MQIGDWTAWHDEYEDPDSELTARMRAVRSHVAAIVDQCPAGPVTVVSICGGQGRELIGALETHKRRADIRGRLIELDTGNATFARAWAQKAQLDQLDIVNGDASVADSYSGLPPADLVVVSGLFGHLDDADQMRTINFLRQLCRNGGRAVWTFYRDERRTEKLRDFFREQMFEEEAFDVLSGKYQFTIARSRYTGTPERFVPHANIFSFGSSRAQAAEAR
jgi:SAM-dependent methyltransferase